ncbi:MAG: hypothetical protein JKX81_13660 [Arenicella sp.]|nr:hypothetical protein [Arenicella sp.]
MADKNQPPAPAVECDDPSNDLFAQDYIAKHLGISDRTLRDVLRKLDLDHRFDTLTKIRITYLSHLRELAAGRGGEEQYNVARERARESRVKADLCELDLHERLGALVLVNDIEPLLEDWILSGQQKITQSLDKLFVELEDTYGIDFDEQYKQDTTRSTLASISGFASEFKWDDEEGIEEMDT